MFKVKHPLGSLVAGFHFSTYHETSLEADKNGVITVEREDSMRELILKEECTPYEEK